MKYLYLLLNFLFFSFSVSAQNVLIEPSGITPNQGGALWTDLSGNIQYSTGKVNVGNAANSDRLNIRSNIGENPLRVQVGGATKLRVFENGAVSLNSNWSNPIPNATRIAGKGIINGKLKVGSDNSADEAGEIRWNNTTEDFEGFDGSNWVSLTRGYTSTGSANTGPPTTPMSTEQQVVPPITGKNKLFGQKVGISGEFAVIIESGIIHFYKYNGVSWEFHSSPTLSVGSLDIYADVSVSINRLNAIIGYPWYNGDKGCVFILTYDINTDTWREEELITASDGVASDYFGWDVEINDKAFVVGANLRDSYGEINSGAVYVFEKSLVSWEEKAILQLSNFRQSDRWGESVSIGNNYVFVGSEKGDSVFVFHKSGGVWGLSQTLVGSGTMTNFGLSLGVSGDYAVVGDLQFQNAAGVAYVFKNTNGQWQEQAVLNPSNNSSDSDFGREVAISGDYIIVAQRFGSQELAFIFKYDGSDWNEIKIIEDPIGQDRDQFGFSISIDSANWISGSPYADSNGYTDQGKVIFGPVE